MMKELALAKVYQLLEPGPVVLLTTARNGRASPKVGRNDNAYAAPIFSICFSPFHHRRR